MASAAQFQEYMRGICNRPGLRRLDGTLDVLAASRSWLRIGAIWEFRLPSRGDWRVFGQVALSSTLTRTPTILEIPDVPATYHGGPSSRVTAQVPTSPEWLSLGIPSSVWRDLHITPHEGGEPLQIPDLRNPRSRELAEEMLASGSVQLSTQPPTFGGAQLRPFGALEGEQR